MSSDEDPPRRPRNFQGITESGEPVSVPIPGWLQNLALLAQRPRIWIAAAILPISFFEASCRLTGRSTIAAPVPCPPEWDGSESVTELIVEEYLFRSVLLPFAVGLFRGGVDILVQLLSILFGPDLEIGRPVGLADSPFALSGPVANTLKGLTLGVIGFIHNIILGVSATIAPLGLAAPTFSAFVWFVLVAVFVWGIYILFSTIDFPFINVKGFALAVSRPVRNLLGGFR